MKSKSLKDTLVYTNPLLWIFGLPFVAGVALASIVSNIGKDTKRVLRDFDNNFKD